MGPFRFNFVAAELYSRLGPETIQACEDGYCGSGGNLISQNLVERFAFLRGIVQRRAQLFANSLWCTTKVRLRQMGNRVQGSKAEKVGRDLPLKI